MGGQGVTPLMMASLACGIVISIVAGLFVFQKIERGFADIV
jgi:hypothetical protein